MWIYLNAANNSQTGGMWVNCDRISALARMYEGQDSECTEVLLEGGDYFHCAEKPEQILARMNGYAKR